MAPRKSMRSLCITAASDSHNSQKLLLYAHALVLSVALLSVPCYKAMYVYENYANLSKWTSIIYVILVAFLCNLCMVQ